MNDEKYVIGSGSFRLLIPMSGAAARKFPLIWMISTWRMKKNI